MSTRPLLAVLSFCCLSGSAAAMQQDARGNSGSMAQFIENEGQWPDDVRFVARSGAFVLRVEQDSLGLDVVRVVEGRREGHAIRIPVAFGPGVRLEGSGRQAGIHSFFLGPDPDSWVAATPSYEAVEYVSSDGTVLRVLLSPRGVALHCIIGEGQVPPLQWSIEGAEVMVDLEGGCFLARTTAGEVRIQGPIVWTRLEGGGDVLAPWRARLDDSGTIDLHPCSASSGEEDCVAPLPVSGAPGFVIDPNLEWSSFLGGSAQEDISDSAVDSAGRRVLVGATGSIDFPTTPGPFSGSSGQFDAVVARVDLATSELISSSIIGSVLGNDFGSALALREHGRVVITGRTDSSGFPTTPGAFDSTHNGKRDVFVLELNPSGTELVFSTLFGSSGDDQAEAIGLDSLGRPIIGGYTQQTGVLPTTPGAFDEIGGPFAFVKRDGFVARFSENGTELVYSTYVAGSADDVIGGMLLLPDDSVLLAGSTESTDYPLTNGTFSGGPKGSYDLAVTILSPQGDALLASSVFGGSSVDSMSAVGTDSTGRIYIAGSTASSDLPTTGGSYQRQYAGLTDGFLARLTPDLVQLDYATYLGTSTGRESCDSISVDASGLTTVAGQSDSGPFPTTQGSLIPTPFLVDAFVARLSPQGDRLFYSTLLGGGPPVSITAPTSVRAAPHGSAFVTGVTESPQFPLTPDALQLDLIGSQDTFLSQLSLLPTGVRKLGTSAESCLGEIYMGVTKMAESGDPTFGITCSGAPPSSGALLSLGFGEYPGGGLVLPEFTYYIDVFKTIVVFPGTSDAAGYAEFDLPLPPGTAGLEFFMQYIWVNTAACGGFGALSASNALGITVQ